MSKTISQVKTDLGGILHSTTVDKVQNVNQVFERIARTMLAKCRPPETIEITQITNAVHDDVYDYSAPAGLYGRKIIDLRPQVNRTESDSFFHEWEREFDKYKTLETFNVKYQKGVKTLRIAASISPLATALHEMDSLTANGTWAADGVGAKNLTADTLDYLSGSASLNFDLDKDATTGYIENSTFSAVDISNYKDIGKLWVRVYIPDPSLITNFILRWGSSSANYWSRTVTGPHDQSAFKTGWQILSFDWNGATETGTGDAAAIDYLRLTVTYSTVADETDIRVDKITASSGRIYELEYYSEYLFETSGGTRKATVDDDADVLILDEDGYNIFLRECQLDVAQQLQSESAAYDRTDAKEHLYGDGTRSNLGLYSYYKKEHPDRSLKPKNYYWKWSTYNNRKSSK